MRIKWYGQSFFRIVFGGRKGTRIAIDPFGSDIGLKVPKIKAHILLISGNSDSNPKAIKGNPFLINAPGEYELREAFIKGIPAFSHSSKDNKSQGDITMYTIKAQDWVVAHLSKLGQKELTSQQLEQLGEVDVLLVPVGAKNTIGPAEASKIISQIEPKVVIPMRYKLPKLKPKLAKLDEFLKVMGQKSIEAQSKFKLKAKNIPQEETKLVVLKP